MSYRKLSNELQKIAEIELKEVPARIAEDIAHIRKWLKQQPHLRAIEPDDQWTLNFLRGCKFSLQRTKEKLDTFYTMKSLLPEFYADRDPFRPEIQEILKLGLCLPLFGTLEGAGPRIVYVRCEPSDPEKIPFVNVMKVCLMIIDILLKEDDNFVVAGQQGLIDLNNMSVNHMLYLNINVCKKANTCLQNGYPMRPKGFHCINIPVFFDKLFNIFRPFVTEKIKNRIFIYNENNINCIYKTIPSSIFPNDRNGNGNTFEELTDYWKKKVESYRDWFLKDAKNCSDETKRVGMPKTSADIFGVEGSFRQLSLD